MPALASKTCMAMTVNVYEERCFPQELGERTTPNLRLAEAGIKDSKSRAVGHNDCFGVKKLGYVT